MPKEMPLKNIFNDMPNLDEIKADIIRFKNYVESKKDRSISSNKLNELKPTLFDTKGQLKIPKTSYNRSPLKINISLDSKLTNLTITVIARLNSSAPQYTGSASKHIDLFLADDFDQYDFYAMIEKCVNSFSTDDIESIEEIFELAGIDDMNEFVQQIFATDEFESYYDENNVSERDVKRIIDKMIMSSKYGLPWFESMLISKTSKDGFDYSSIADELILILSNKIKL